MVTTITTISRNEISKLMKLIVPLVLTGFIEASVGFFTTFFLARLGEAELAAGAVVQWIFFTLMVILWGTLCSVSVLIAQKQGAKDERGIAQVLLDGLWLSLLFVIPAFFLLRHVGPLLQLAGQDAATVQLAETYMQGLSWGLLPDFVGIVLMQFLIGLGHTRTNLFFTLLWVPLNIVSNYVLIFGKCGFPAMGMAGIGWGTMLAYWILLVVMLTYLVFSATYRRYFEMLCRLRPSRFFGELCQIGFPMGSMYCIEIAFFLTVTILMGRINSEELAGNQIALQFLGQMSVVTFAVAQAVTVRMSHALGAKQGKLAAQAAALGMLISASFMAVVAIVYWVCPDLLIAIDLDMSLPANGDVIHYTRQFLAICAVFEILEALRLVLFGALRALKDTRYTLLASIISFWGVALPLGYGFAIPLHQGGVGLWYGLVLGAMVGVLLLYVRFQRKMRETLAVPQDTPLPPACDIVPLSAA